ncbi:cation/H(+) antiporter 15-like [Andrographis paniculata]|uniref:cation/H(+) antiporter 15-like n=1 Tax=Andrographis paniculata TaxID=175694 RepID=UPI0021E7C542|nr:cation/H(+) antiporter 15-like [Andrographis paniculata]
MSKEPLSPSNDTEQTIVCYAPTMITTNGIWQGDNPLDYSLPLFILQLTLVVVTTRLLVLVLRPLRQPRVIAEILGGIILGPSVLGQSNKFATTVFPLRSVMVLETMANVGLLYFLFLVGVEMDISVIRRTGRKAISIAIAGMVLPFLIGVFYALVLEEKLRPDFVKLGTFILFLGVSLSVTAFPVLARVLAELKLLNTEIGRIAMSSALINDICAWVLLALAIALAENEAMSLASVWVLLSSVAFVLFCIFVLRPFISWSAGRTPEGESISEFYICLILTGVMVCGFITDAIGTHSVFGAFVFGLIIPNGPLGVILIERLEDFVSGLLLPLFFAISGLKTNLASITGVSTWAVLALVTALACMGKIVGTLLVCLYNKMPFYEGLTLGVLMNAKGLVEMIVLNVGKDQKVLDDKAFSTLVIATVAMTSIIAPAVTNIYKPARKATPYTRRTIQRSDQGELRVLACVHTPRNAPTMINLLEASHPNKASPIYALVLHLVELTGRASAMLIVHNTHNQQQQQKSGSGSGAPGLDPTQAQTDHIINAFRNFEQQVGGFVSVQSLTTISPYSTMHEDICSVAEDKHVAFIILPFHKQQTVDGAMEATNPAYRTINQNVLANAPCSVGILVDRGLTGAARLPNQQQPGAHHVAVLFFGGADDREALAYGWRMSRHPEISLTVLRFVSGEQASRHADADADAMGDHSYGDEDEGCLNQFKAQTENDPWVNYIEQVVNHGEETVATIRSIDVVHDLFVVGRGRGRESPLTAGLTDWSECPELGAIGDLLASSDFAATYSVVVVQQYTGVGVGVENELIRSP